MKNKVIYSGLAAFHFTFNLMPYRIEFEGMQPPFNVNIFKNNDYIETYRVLNAANKSNAKDILLHFLNS